MTFDPDWTVAPGELLMEEMAERGLTGLRLARLIQIHPHELSSLLRGDAELTETIAGRLDAAGIGNARVWLNMERLYREGLARGKSRL